MTRRSKLSEYEALLSSYPPDTPLKRIAEIHRIPYSTLYSYVREHRLRAPNESRLRRHSVVRRLLADMPQERQRRINGTRGATFLEVVKEGRRQGYEVVLVSKSLLDDMLAKVNDLRGQDISGPEACGALTDIILDAMEAQP